VETVPEEVMAKTVDKFVVYNLRETYHELGEYEFKVVLNPRYFKNSHLSELVVFDSDRRVIQQEVNKWGRKMNCKFRIDKDVSDGVAVVELILKTERDSIPARLSFWVIKP
jgi:hypothetical protein